MRNKILFLCLTMVLALVVIATTACGGGTSSTTPASSTAPVQTSAAPTTSSAAPAPTTTSAAPTTTVVKPKYGGTLRTMLGNPPGSYDLHRMATNAGYFTSMVFNNLVCYRTDTGTGAVVENIVGDLAEKWTVSPDNLVYTFTLRQNVKWHNGSAFTADDVVYSLKKMTDSTRSAITSYFTTVSAIDKVDTYTVKITLKSPTPTFLTNLANTPAVIQAASTETVDTRSTDFLMGTGPFMFKAYTPGSQFSVVKNPNYFDKDKDGNPLPYLDGIVEYVIPDRSAQLDALVSNRVDMTDPLTGIATQDEFNRVQKEAPTVVTQFVKTPIGETFWFNTDYAPLKDIRVRQAMTLLVDWPLTRTAGSGAAQWAVYEDGLFTSPYGLTYEQIKKLLGWDMTWEQRVAKAQQLMKDAGYPDGFNLSMVTTSIANYQNMMTYTADVFRKNLKINSTITTYPSAQIMSMRMSKQWQLLCAAPVTSTGDPNELAPYFVKDGRTNWLGYYNDTVEKLFTQQAAAMDLNERIKITQQIETQLLTDLWVMPGSKHTNGAGTYPYVIGYKVMHYGPYMRFDKVWMNK